MKTLRTLIIASLLLLTGSMGALADDYQYLTVTQSGSETSFTVNSIQKITFDATDMVLQMTDGTSQRLPLSGLSKMFFSTSPTGIGAVVQGKPKFQIVGGQLQAAMNPGERITIYNMKGEAVFTSAAADATFNLSTLMKGVYIVKTGTEVRKVVNK